MGTATQIPTFIQKIQILHFWYPDVYKRQTYNCSIALGYKKDGLSLFVVILGDTGAERTKDVKKLIQYATAKVEGQKVIGSGKESGRVRIKHGAKTSVTAYTAETGYAYLPKEDVYKRQVHCRTGWKNPAAQSRTGRSAYKGRNGYPF